jgi:phospholipid/cholesterol/gamma-HCH transport system permease protein
VAAGSSLAASAGRPGGAPLRYAGARLDLAAAIELLKRVAGSPVVIDLSGVKEFTGGGAAALVVLARDHGVRFENTPKDLLRYLEELPLGELAAAHSLQPGVEEEEELPGATDGGFLSTSLATARWFLALAFEFVYWVAVAPWRGARLRLGKTVTELNRVGVEAIPIVALIAALMGVILALNAAGQLRIYGAEKYTANLVGIALTRELAPVITAILVAGRSGSAIAAELATMKVSDEIDALEVMGINPRAFLLVPKLLAVTVGIPVLVVLASLVGIGGGFIVAVFGLDLPFALYWEQTVQALHVRDLALGALKALCFGSLVGLTGCTYGMRVTGGATGVGRATTTAVVVSYVLVIVANALFTLLFFLAGW